MITYNMFYLTGNDIRIPGGMTFTMNSDLNEDSLQFTLTCTSTGGPVTFVSWSRNRGAVPGGISMIVLDDPVTAQYTNTLIGTEREGGLYRCAVTNNQLLADTAELTVQGGVCM